MKTTVVIYRVAQIVA